MAFGVTPQGFIAKQQAEIVAEIQASLQGTLGLNINFTPRSVISQLINTFSEREALLWQLAEALYNSQYPDTAEGVSLDNVGAISGIPRMGALASRVLDQRLFGTAGTPIPAGTEFSVQGSSSSKFTTDSAVVLSAGQNSIQELAFSETPLSGTWKINWGGRETDALQYNANNATIQAALQALLFGSGALVTGSYGAGIIVEWAGASGKQVQPLIVISDSTLQGVSDPVDITITETQEGQNQAIVDCTATETGPIIAEAGTLVVIDTPVSGLTSVLNVTDAIVGRNVESDSDYRLRRSQELQIAGAGTVEAIRAKLLTVEGVTAVIVFENDSEIVDPDGRSPKSFEAVVEGAEDQAIADQLWLVKPAGIRTLGTESVEITDSQGQTHNIRFSRPTALLIYIEIDLTVDETFPANGEASVRQALIDAGNALGIGKEVVVMPYLVAALADIPGILDLELLIGTAPNPTESDNIDVDPNEVASFDSSRVDVNAHT